MLHTLSDHISASTPRKERRWMTSGKQQGPDKEKAESQDVAAAETQTGKLSSIVRSVGPTLRKVTEWNTGDLLSVYAIVLLIVLIILSPYVIA